MSLHTRLTHSLSLYSQSIHKPHTTAVPRNQLVRIHNSNTKLTLQPSHSLNQFLFKSQSQTSLYRYPIHSASPYSQPNHKPQSKVSNHSVSLYSQPSLKPRFKVVPITPSACIISPITNISLQLSHQLRQTVFTVQSQNSLHRYPTHSVSLYSQCNYKTHFTDVAFSQFTFTVQSKAQSTVPLTPIVCFAVHTQI
jgi:hypothetical protein